MPSANDPPDKPGGDVTVIVPNARVAARWNGALEMRLRHAPLEAFLRSRGRKWVAAGEARISDNIASATIFLVESALALRQEAPEKAHHRVVARLGCAVSMGLCSQIREPTAWRIGALIAAARLLAPHVGLDAAAQLAAAAARDFNKRLSAGSQDAEMLHLSMLAGGVIAANDAALYDELVLFMAGQLDLAQRADQAQSAAAL
jgi:hypothetical protein